MSYKIGLLAQGGRNAQGVPLGLVNYMCYNRMQVQDNTHRWQGEHSLTRHLVVDPPRKRVGTAIKRGIYGERGWASAILWRALSLTPQEATVIRGFVTINRLDWRKNQ